MSNMQNGSPITQQVGAYNTYVGARYVPLIMGQWDSTLNYEPLSIVISQGNSYTSKQYVPAGTPLTNDLFWVQTGNFDGQLYDLINRVNALEDSIQKQVIHTADYYGIIGNGTDETTTFNTALQTASLNGVTLKIPSNMNIGITGKIILPSNTHIILEGMITLLAADTAYIASFDSNPHSLYSGNKNIIIEGNGKINGNSLNLTEPTQTPLRFYHNTNIMVRGITIELYGTYHAIELGGVDTGIIDNVKFLGCITPPSSTEPESAIQIEPTYGEHGQGGGIPYDNTPCKNIIIQNCYFGKSTLGGYNVNCGIESQWQGNENVAWHENIYIRNNHFDNLPAMAVAPHAWKNAIIENNIANNLSLGFVSAIDYTKDGIKNGIIKNNMVNGCNTSVTSVTSISTIITVGNYEDVIVVNNVFKGNKTTSFAFFNSENIDIVNNIIESCLLNTNNPEYSYLYFSSCNNVNISNNIFNSTSKTNSFFSAGNKPTNCNVMGNIIQNENYNMERLQQINQDYVSIWTGNLYIGSIPLGSAQSKFTSYLIKVEFDSGATDYCTIDINKSTYGGAGYTIVTNTEVSNYDIKFYINGSNFEVFRCNKAVGETITVGTQTEGPIKVTQIWGIQNKNVLY